MPCLSLSSYFKPNLLSGETSDSRLVAVADRNFPNGLFAECTKKTSLRPNCRQNHRFEASLNFNKIMCTAQSVGFLFFFLFAIFYGIVKGFNTMWLSIST